VVISPNPAGLSSVKIAQKLATTLSQLSNDKYSLQSTFALKTTDDGVIINRKQNDTIRITTEFSDYYAYDDGTAEAGAYLGKGFGRIAAQFTNNSNDVVSGVRINLLPMLTNLEGNAITIQIMENDKGKPGNVIRSLYSKVV
jgi:predicted house-cleaning NTP pyrophosphatase (Maf/HAM1 superfamily)